MDLPCKKSATADWALVYEVSITTYPRNNFYFIIFEYYAIHRKKGADYDSISYRQSYPLLKENKTGDYFTKESPSQRFSAKDLML